VAVYVDVMHTLSRRIAVFICWEKNKKEENNSGRTVVNGQYLDSAKYVNRLVKESDDPKGTLKIIKGIVKDCGLLYVPRERGSFSDFLHKITETAYRQIHLTDNPYSSRLMTFFERLKEFEKSKYFNGKTDAQTIDSMLEQDELTTI